MLEVKCKGGVWAACRDVGQVIVLLILEELSVGFADPELWGGADAENALQGSGAAQPPVQVLHTRMSGKCKGQQCGSHQHQINELASHQDQINELQQC